MMHSITTLYSSEHTAQDTALFAFFVVEDSLNTQALTAFKQASQAKLLIALNTQPKNIDSTLDILAVADTVIYCTDNEINTIIEVFERFFSEDAFISLDEDDLVTIFKDQKTVFFTHAHGVKNPNESRAENAMKDGIEDIFTDVPLLSLCMLVEGRDIGFEEFDTITAVTSKYPYTNEMMTYYGLNNLTETGSQNELDVWIFGCQN